VDFTLRSLSAISPGVVEAGPPEWIEAQVWGTGGDTGASVYKNVIFHGRG
jgi:hypothetical protein